MYRGSGIAPSICVCGMGVEPLASLYVATMGDKNINKCVRVLRAEEWMQWYYLNQARFYSGQASVYYPSVTMRTIIIPGGCFVFSRINSTIVRREYVFLSGDVSLAPTPVCVAYLYAWIITRRCYSR